LYGLDRAWEEEQFDLNTIDAARLVENQGWVSPEALARRKATLEAKRKRIIELRVEGLISKDDMDQRLLPISEEMQQLEQAAGTVDERATAVKILAQDGIAPAKAWPGMTSTEQRRLVGTLLRGPLEVEVGPDGLARLYANTWLFAAQWEAWETRRDFSRKPTPDQNGRLASAVRAPD
jgi:hypothetical protein